MEAGFSAIEAQGHGSRSGMSAVHRAGIVFAAGCALYAATHPDIVRALLATTP